MVLYDKISVFCLANSGRREGRTPSDGTELELVVAQFSQVNLGDMWLLVASNLLSATVVATYRRVSNISHNSSLSFWSSF